MSPVYNRIDIKGYRVLASERQDQLYIHLAPSGRVKVACPCCGVVRVYSKERYTAKRVISTALASLVCSSSIAVVPFAGLATALLSSPRRDCVLAAIAPSPIASAFAGITTKVTTGNALYRLHKQTVEPVFGILKEGMGYVDFCCAALRKQPLNGISSARCRGVQGFDLYSRWPYAYLMIVEQPIPFDVRTTLRTPLASASVQAGFPSPAEDHMENSLDLNEHLVSNPAATFFVRVRGNSMRDAGIQGGDILVVDRSITPSDRQIVIAMLDGEFTVKRLCKRGERIFLEAANADFAPIEIRESQELTIWGAVTFVIHPAR